MTETNDNKENRKECCFDTIPNMHANKRVVVQHIYRTQEQIMGNCLARIPNIGTKIALTNCGYSQRFLFDIF